MNLPQTRAKVAESLAANGLSDATIRQELGMTPAEWKLSLAEHESDLAQALADGRARLIESALAVVIEAAKAGDVASAKWLVTTLSPEQKRDAGKGINITLTLPRSMDDYLRIVEASDED
jgi:hypothetical protein